MSQQSLDLRKSIQLVRRRKRTLGCITGIGLLAGIAYALLIPPMLSSTALVVISGNPASITSQANSSSPNPAIDTSIATQLVIASSAPVLAGALPSIRPPMTSTQELGKKISVTAVGGSDVLSVTATGQTAVESENIANAVANSYVKYVGTSTNPAVQVQAKLVEAATIATGPQFPEYLGEYAILGALAGAIVGFVTCLALGKSDRRLVTREEIANSIAVPVLAAIPVASPSDPASWAKLLAEYEPDAVHSYGLTKLLKQLSVLGNDANATRVDSPSLTVLSLASDPTALALGPQLAAFASARGVPTTLVLGPQQDMNATASLRATCANWVNSMSERGKPLRLLTTEDDRISRDGPTFTVVVAVIDGQNPRVQPMIRTTTTVLGVSSDGATAADLARVASAATADGRDIYGFFVANPDRGDQTTGRIPSMPSIRRAFPTRVNGLAMEISR